MKGSGSAVPKVSLTSVVVTISTLPKDRKQLSVWAENTACHVRCVRVEEGKGKSCQLSPEEGKGKSCQLSPEEGKGKLCQLSPEEGKGKSCQLSPEEGKGKPRQLSPVPVSVTVALNLHVRWQQQKQQNNYD